MIQCAFWLVFAGWSQTTQPAPADKSPYEVLCGPICYQLVMELYAPERLQPLDPEMFGGNETSALTLRDKLRGEGFAGSLCARFRDAAELTRLAKPAILVLQLRPEQKHYVLYVGAGERGSFALLNYEPGELREFSAAELEQQWTREAIIVSREKLTPTSRPVSRPAR